MCALPGELVLSDVHTNYVHPAAATSGCAVSSRFPFVLGSQDGAEKEEGSEDEDGDIIISKRHEEDPMANDVITIEHTMATGIDKVGLQVWMASFLLCDFILANAPLFRDQYILELGGGTGLCSILLASLDPRAVLCTDTGSDVLTLCQKNISYNSHLTGHVTVRVRDLDWTQDHYSRDTQGAFDWSDMDESVLGHVKFIIAADVIYDDRLTDAFFKTLLRLMKRNGGMSAFIALERRLNFTLDQMRVRSPAHDHFLVWVDRLKKEHGLWCQQLETTFPQCFEYTRTEHLDHVSNVMVLERVGIVRVCRPIHDRQLRFSGLMVHLPVDDPAHRQDPVSMSYGKFPAQLVRGNGE